MRKNENKFRSEMRKKETSPCGIPGGNELIPLGGLTENHTKQKKTEENHL